MAQKALQLANTAQEKAEAQYRIGLSYYSQGNKKASEEAELLALSLDSGYEPPYVTLSAIKLDQKDCNQAFIYADKALSLTPNDPWALNNSGLAYFCLGDIKNAIIQLQKAVSLAPNSNIIRNNLNIVLQQ
jgi:tetratricopeptide (TPR) repeat protein